MLDIVSMPVVWFVFLIGLSAGIVATKWWFARRTKQENAVNKDYFRGLNFVLNEEPDKAIEVFIRALEVDSETVELHLALGGLFRKKGQVDRATRIHQNLIARPSLTEGQRLQAIYELAQDYNKAGLLDRAENLFLELKESESYRFLALEGLAAIYQQQKDWSQAIDVARQHRRADRPQSQTRLAHYWCELAELSLNENQFEAAHKYLKQAQATDKNLARAVMLRAQLNYQQDECKRALTHWLSLIPTKPILVTLAVESIIDCFNKLDDSKGLAQFLLEIPELPRSEAAFSAWWQALIKQFGEQKAQEHLFERLRVSGLNSTSAQAAFEIAEQQLKTQSENGTSVQLQKLAHDLLKQAKSSQIEYTCRRCGFGTKFFYWVCPNCSEWDSFGFIKNTDMWLSKG